MSSNPTGRPGTRAPPPTACGSGRTTVTESRRSWSDPPATRPAGRSSASDSALGVAHHETFDRVLLVDRGQLLHDRAVQVVLDLLRQALPVAAGDGQVMAF